MVANGFTSNFTTTMQVLHKLLLSIIFIAQSVLSSTDALEEELRQYHELMRSFMNDSDSGLTETIEPVSTETNTDLIEDQTFVSPAFYQACTNHDYAQIATFFTQPPYPTIKEVGDCIKDNSGEQYNMIRRFLLSHEDMIRQEELFQSILAPLVGDQYIGVPPNRVSSFIENVKDGKIKKNSEEWKQAIKRSSDKNVINIFLDYLHNPKNESIYSICGNQSDLLLDLLFRGIVSPKARNFSLFFEAILNYDMKLLILLSQKCPDLTRKRVLQLVDYAIAYQPKAIYIVLKAFNDKITGRILYNIYQSNIDHFYSAFNSLDVETTLNCLPDILDMLLAPITYEEEPLDLSAINQILKVLVNDTRVHQSHFIGTTLHSLSSLDGQGTNISPFCKRFDLQCSIYCRP